jgi:hypothetical protein
MTSVQCQRFLLHHIATGACVDYAVNSSLSLRPDRSASCAPQNLESAVDMSKAVLNIFLEADHKQMSTDNLSRLAAALDVSVSGVCTICFRFRAAIRKHAAPLPLRTRTFIPLRQLLTFSTPLKVTESLVFCRLLHCITFTFQKDPQLSHYVPRLQSTYYLENAHSKSSDSWLTICRTQNW